MPSGLSLLKQPTLSSPDRGPLLGPAAIYARFFGAGFDVKPESRTAWLKRILPAEIRVQISKRRWGAYANDVEAHLERLRGS